MKINFKKAQALKEGSCRDRARTSYASISSSYEWLHRDDEDQEGIHVHSWLTEFVSHLLLLFTESTHRSPFANETSSWGTSPFSSPSVSASSASSTFAYPFLVGNVAKETSETNEPATEIRSYESSSSTSPSSSYSGSTAASSSSSASVAAPPPLPPAVRALFTASHDTAVLGGFLQWFHRGFMEEVNYVNTLLSTSPAFSRGLALSSSSSSSSAVSYSSSSSVLASSYSIHLTFSTKVTDSLLNASSPSSYWNLLVDILNNPYYFLPLSFANILKIYFCAGQIPSGPARDWALEKKHNTLLDAVRASPSRLDVNKAFSAIRDLYAGITYINAPTIGGSAPALRRHEG